MQWVRSQVGTFTPNNHKELIGIRYFSCASIKASEMGFNYVFPTSGQQISEAFPFCTLLAKSFLLTSPVLIRDNKHLDWSERELFEYNNYCYVYDYNNGT